MIASLIYLVIYIVVLGLVLWLLIFLLDNLQVPEPFHRVGRVVVIVIGVLILILLLLRFAGFYEPRLGRIGSGAPLIEETRR